MEDEEIELKVGDLVKYKHPRNFFSNDMASKNVFGVIACVHGAFHAKVFWTDGLHCLESFEDLSLVERLIIKDKE